MKSTKNHKEQMKSQNKEKYKFLNILPIPLISGNHHKTTKHPTFKYFKSMLYLKKSTTDKIIRNESNVNKIKY